MTTCKTFLCLLIIPLSLLLQNVWLGEKAEAAGQSSACSIRGKHAIELSLGLLSKFRSATMVSAGSTTTESEANGFIGSITYTHWLEEQVSIHITSGALDVDASTSVDGSRTFMETSTVVPLLFGVKYSPFRRPIGDVMRPFVSASVGPYIGFTSKVRSGTDTRRESYSETALGSRLGAGVDLSISRLFILGVSAGYHFVEDFNNRIGAEKNYSSPDFSLSLGVIFGKGK